jgi:hypothetical protein
MGKSGGGLWGIDGGKAVGEMPLTHYSHAGDALSLLDFSHGEETRCEHRFDCGL